MWYHHPDDAPQSFADKSDGGLLTCMTSVLPEKSTSKCLRVPLPFSTRWKSELAGLLGRTLYIPGARRRPAHFLAV